MPQVEFVYSITQQHRQLSESVALSSERNKQLLNFDDGLMMANYNNL